jgi:hypothetical protein
LNVDSTPAIAIALPPPPNLKQASFPRKKFINNFWKDEVGKPGEILICVRTINEAGCSVSLFKFLFAPSQLPPGYFNSFDISSSQYEVSTATRRRGGQNNVKGQKRMRQKTGEKGCKIIRIKIKGQKENGFEAEAVSEKYDNERELKRKTGWMEYNNSCEPRLTDSPFS